jgi:hypothetical protein
MQNIVDKVFPHFAKEEAGGNKQIFLAILRFLVMQRFCRKGKI